MTDRDRMIVENMNLVRFYARQYRHYGVSYPDLEQSGMIGLIRAVDKYDTSKGKFSTFATFHIKERIFDALSSNGVVKMGTYGARQRRQITKAVNNFTHIKGREPNVEELTKLTGFTPEEIDLYRSFSYADPENALPEGDPNHPSTEHVEEQTPVANIERLFKDLTEKEALVIQLRFGIGTEDEQEQTLSTISCKLSISRERVRQIEARALDKLMDTPVRVIEECWPKRKLRR